MATSSATLCPVCNKDLDEIQRSPRHLPCSHWICNSCYAKSIRDNGHICPICDKNKDTSAFNFERNAAGIDVCPYRQRTVPQANRVNQLMGENKRVCNELLTNCQKAGVHLHGSIGANNDLRNTILQQDKDLSETMAKMKEVEKGNKKMLKYFDRKDASIKLSLQEVERKTRDLRAIQRRQDAAGSFQEAAPILDETEVLYSNVQKWMNDLDDSIAEEECTRQDIEGNVQGMNENLSLIHEILTTTENQCKKIDFKGEEDHLGYLLPNMTMMTLKRKNNTPTPLAVDDLRPMTPLMRCHLAEKRVFVSKIHKGKERYGILSLSENNELLLSHLKERKLPPNAQVLQYKDVMKRGNTSPQLAFLTLGDNSANIGTLYIRLFSTNKRTQHFSRLCTGEMGSSYAKTRLLQVGNKSNDKLEFVRFGDYENNDGSGGRPLFPGLFDEDDDDDLSMPCLAGVVGGVCRKGTQIGGQFIIRTKDNLTRSCSPSFGKVEKGLDILDKIIKQYCSIKEVFIKECGLVLWPKGGQGGGPAGGFRTQSRRDHRRQGDSPCTDFQ